MPSAVALPTLSEPALIVVPPVKVFAPFNTKIPVPLNVNAVLPLMTPALVWLDVVDDDEIVKLANLAAELIETAPVPALIVSALDGKAKTTVPAPPEPPVALPAPGAPP